MNAYLVDCHDSFTWNIDALLHGLGIDVDTVRVDMLDQEALVTSDLVVLGPGPGRPSDYPVLEEICLRRGERPILGICLGAQAMAVNEGARLLEGYPIHGIPSRLHHDGGAEFEGLSDSFQGMRYHSLQVVDFPATCVACAWSEDQTAMAWRVQDRPWFGIQFHPESVGSVEGSVLLRNVLKGWELL